MASTTASWTNITANSAPTALSPIWRRLSAAMLVIVGLAVTTAGLWSLQNTMRTAEWITAGVRVRNGGVVLSTAQLVETIRHLEHLSSPTPDALAALTFLHYAAADDAARRRETEPWQDELAATEAAAHRALAVSPGRADVSLALAEVEFLRVGPGPTVYAPLELSYRTAPRELWIAERRIGLGLRLVAVAPRQIGDDVTADIRLLGEPFRDPENYRTLAREAYLAGPAAIATVRRELGFGHPWPFRLFEQYLGELAARPPATPAGERQPN